MNRPLIEAIDQDTYKGPGNDMESRCELKELNHQYKGPHKDKAPSAAGYFYVLCLLHFIQKLKNWHEEDDK
jgi:hypothetical protein